MNALILLDADGIKKGSMARFFELQKMWRLQVGRPTGSSVSLQKLYQPLAANISRSKILECGSDAFSQFVEAACHVVQEAFASKREQSNSSELSVEPAVLNCITRRCRLCAVGPATQHARSVAAVTWIYLNMVACRPAGMDAPETFVGGILGDLVPLGLKEDDLSRCGRTQFALHVSDQISIGMTAGHTQLNG